jgi:threonine synthase
MHLTCQDTGTAYPVSDLRWRSEAGAPFDLQFDAKIDREALRSRPPTMWRYREALPLEDDAHIVSFGEGMTPMVSWELDGKPVWVKQENLFPTGSFKDRGASLLISRALELGVQNVIEDSSGNAGAAVAAYAAKAGIQCDIYVPEATSPAKLSQIQLYGANLHRVPGSREDTARAAEAAAGASFYASHVWNPFFLHGTKTFAYEVWEQLNFRAPDAVVLPVGHGTLLIGAYLGFRDLVETGHISRVPRIVGVQAANCAPLSRMWQESLGSLPDLAQTDTMAEGIAIAEPVRYRQILGIIRETGGDIVAVTEGHTKQALLDAARAGFYIEPTSATALAAFRNLEISSADVVVVPLTGHGLKSADKLLKLCS